MSKHEKLLERLRKRLTDFGWDELQRLLGFLGYEEEKGEGSRRKFIHSKTNVVVSIHELHPRRILKEYQ